MKSLFVLDDKQTGDRFEIELDEAGDRLLIHSAIDRQGERVMVLVDARRVARELADALVLAMAGVPAATAPKPRSPKVPRIVALDR